ncbi:MAG: ABC transporter permease [Butyrivibrio sp.]|nr:ABC transporter permease [Butyrivibrio sp.]
MKLALKELIYNKKKYILIELIIVLLMFMVLFLSGLVEGLGRAVIAGIDNIDADCFLISDSAENVITVSDFKPEKFEQLQAQTEAELAALDIQRMFLSKKDAAEKLNITYFAFEPGSFIEPDVVDGVRLSASNLQNPIVLDESLKNDGIALGDTVYDSSSGIEFTVVGFAEDSMYGHTPIGFISTDSYTAIRTALNPMYQKAYHAVAIKGRDTAGIQIDGTEIVPKSDIIENIPSYKAEHLTITMIIWVLVVVSAAIIGVFYYIITLQKHKQFGVMKAIGTGMERIFAMVTGQVCVIAVSGALISALLTYLMAMAIPSAMPFYLKNGNVVLVIAAFILISVAGGLISVLSISRVDPMEVIGGSGE